jgi:hypothetical protein
MQGVFTKILTLLGGVWFSISVVYGQEGIGRVPLWEDQKFSPEKHDWLLGGTTTKAGVFRSRDGKDIILYNGLLRRVFRITPNVACTDFTNLSNGQQLLRAVKPEARISLNGHDYTIGGLYGQMEQAYLREEWIDGLTAGEQDFQLMDVRVRELEPPLLRTVRTWPGKPLPATGKELTFIFGTTAPGLEGVLVRVHYAIHDGIPLIVKWMTLENKSIEKLQISTPVNEILALVEEESAVVGSPEQMKKPQGIYIESNYAFNNAMRYSLSDQTTHWKTDPSYTSQVNYNYQTPCLLEVYPEKFLGLSLPPGGEFTSLRTYELLLDSYDRERRGLAIRKMYRTVAPWVTENPIFMHLVSKTDEEVYRAIDQCATTGYEALILSFGSHFNLEDTSAANLSKWKSIADYAHAKNILIGGYSLFSSRRISDEDDVIDPVSGKPNAAAFFGQAPCMGSKWGLAYLDKILHFFRTTGFDLFENDGPYPGDVCASTTHPGHEGLHDSQWRQMELQKGLYRQLRQMGVYINAPDWYFLDGTNKIALGYREVNFSLSRAQQKILNRQNIYDGLWEKTPSMGWGFVPLTKYHGGGPESILEPLSEHLSDYEQLMMQYYGAGVQACYRGPRLYDSEATRQTVIRVIDWYRKYRDVLNADIIHLRRADGRDWDGILHADPVGDLPGMFLLFNPLNEPIRRTISLPLYYTGLDKYAWIREKEGQSKRYVLNRDFTVSFTFELPANGYSWFVVERKY